MKKLILIILLLAMASPAWAQGGSGTGSPVPGAQTVTLQWDAMPAGEAWKEVRVYEIAGNQYIRVATVAGTETRAVIVGVAPGVHTYVVRSFQVWESVDSNSAVTPGVPAAPMSMTVTVTASGG